MKKNKKDSFKFKTSIKMKLIVISFLLLSIPLTVLSVLSYQKSAESLNRLGETNLKNSVEMTIQMIESLNREVENGNITLEEAQNEVKTAILGEKDAEGKRPINKDVDLGENGYMFVLSASGVQIAAPEGEGDDVWDATDVDGRKFIQEMIEVGGTGGGFVYYDWPLLGNEDQLEPKVAYSKTEPNWNWTVSSGTYMMDFNKPASEVLTLILLVSSAALIIGAIIIWLFANKLSKPIRAVTKQLNHLADKDLKVAPVTVKATDETGQLASALNHMQSELKGIIENVSTASEVITSQSEELTQSTDEVRLGTEQVATTMQELASGSESQANLATDMSSAMGSFLIKVDEANDNGGLIQRSSKSVMSMTEKGEQLMDESTIQMEKVDEIVHSSVQKVQGLDKHSQKISALVSVIKDIAEQTNLLALNAAIEAARAGEHGKGFAVVATEVRKLAEQSAASVVDITDIVSQIQSESSNVASSLLEGYKEVEQGTKKMMITKETFNEISGAVTDVANNIEVVSTNLAEIKKDSQQVNNSIEEIAAISEESAAGVEQTSASSQQISSSMEEMLKSSNDLAKLAEQLNEIVHEFKL
ncbi:methyl-accepting chemotaxis protein [Virgibacillus sp. W0181]|uniref:methyl-accepting chemotaxis protein n=1 Tax=Virgibacillus sp. W0181 TaxID=3391581 RepID=UPI003F47AAB3